MGEDARHNRSIGLRSLNIEALKNWFERHDMLILPAPSVIIVLSMLIFPVLFTLYLSFFNWSGGTKPPRFVFLENYQSLFTDVRFYKSVLNTLIFVSLAITIQVTLGTLTALVFHRPFMGRGIARSFFLFPMMATPSAIALVWKMMLDPTLGSLPYLIQQITGIKVTLAADAKTVIPTLVMVDTWQWTPLVTLIILAGLASLPLEPFEAAQVDGASALQRFFFITLPLLRPTIAVAAMFRAIDAIKTFDIIMVITDGGPSYASEILNLYAYRQSLDYLNFGYGSVLLIALTLLVTIVALFFNRFRRGGFWS